MRVLTRSTSSLVGGSADDPFDGLQQDLAGFVDGLVHLEADGGHDEARVVQIKHSHVSADGLLVIDKGLVEAARRTVSEDTGEDVERGVIRVGTGGAVIDDHQVPGYRRRGGG